MIAQLFFFSIKRQKGPMAEWVLKFYWVFKPINKLKNLSQASAWREMKITILTNPILTKSMCNFDESRSKHWEVHVATVTNQHQKTTSPWIISGNLHTPGSHSSLKKSSGGVKEWQGKAQWSDLGLIKIPPLTKETKNAAKCWHLQFLAMVSYLDNIIGHFWSWISQAFDQLQSYLIFVTGATGNRFNAKNWQFTV